MTALADFDSLAAEQALLQAAFFDPNIAVRRNAISGFRGRRRQLSEDSAPCPSAAPVPPAAAARQSHRDEHRRRAAQPLNSSFLEPLTEVAPDLPLTPVELWQQEALKGSATKPSSICLHFCFLEFQRVNERATSEDIDSFLESISLVSGNESRPQEWLQLPLEFRRRYELMVRCVW